MGTELRSEIEWVNGMPRLVYREAYTKPALSALTHSVLALPFVPREGNEEDQQYIGLTMGEVMLMRQAASASYGDLLSTQYFSDRILGKPKQSVETTSISMTISEYLDALPNEAPAAIDVEKYKVLELKQADQTPVKLNEKKIYRYAHLGDDL